MARILLSAAGGSVAPTIIRHLQDHGHRVIGMDTQADAVGLHFCDEFIPAPLATDAAHYLAFLANIQSRFDIFFPFIDEELTTLATHWSQLPTELAAKIVVSPPETLLTCTDKNRFQHACEQAHLPIAPRASQPPAIAKPWRGRGGKGVVSLYDHELLSYYARQPNYLIQKMIDGVEYTVDMLLTRDAKPYSAVARKRLLAKGVSINAQIDMAPDVLALAYQCAATLPFYGPINIQIMRELPSNDLYIIEINPRLSGSVRFTCQAGFDIINLAVHMHTGLALPSITPVIADQMRFWRYWDDVHATP